MNFPVVIQPSAQAAIDKAYRWIRRRSPQGAAGWLLGLQQAILSLKKNPARCGLAPESEVFDLEIRQLLYGKRGGIYRILFTIEKEKDIVSVLFVRHSAQDLLSSEELDIPDKN